MLIVPLVFTFVSINIPHKLARGMCVCVCVLALYEIGLLLLTQNGGNAFFFAPSLERDIHFSSIACNAFPQPCQQNRHTERVSSVDNDIVVESMRQGRT